MEGKQKGPTIAETTRTRIVAVADGASDEQRKRVLELVEQAKKGEKGTIIWVLSPVECALLFLHHNGHNRDWKPETCIEFARRMQKDDWQFNNATLGFYPDGQLGDGQHRLSAAALAGYKLETGIIFGMTRASIVTVDDGKSRHGDDHAKLNGIADASIKGRMVSGRANYLVRSGDKSAKLRSAGDVCGEIQTHDGVLSKAQMIGHSSLQHVADPVLKAVAASTLAYIFLQAGWPESVIASRMAALQAGISHDSEKAPDFVAADIIKSSRGKPALHLNVTKELGIAVGALVAIEKGVKAMHAKTLRDAVRKSVPDPSYPGHDEGGAEFKEAAE
jgi:hypothetical protein